MGDIFGLAVSVLSILDNLNSRNQEYDGLKQSLHATLHMLMDFVSAHSINQDDLITSKHKESLVSGLTSLRDELPDIMSPDTLSTRVKSLFVCVSGLGGSFFGVNKDIARLRDLEGDLAQILQFMRLELMANNNEILARYTGLHTAAPGQESPRQYWYKVFKDAMSVSTESFGSALRSSSKCDSKSAAYIATTLSCDGRVSLDSFVERFDNPSDYFDVADWTRKQISQSDARTVHTPGHLKAITDMKMVGDHLIATSSMDCTIKVFEVSGPTVILKFVLVGHERAVRSFVFTQKTDKIVSISDDKTIRIWDASTGKASGSIATEDNSTHIAECPSERSVVICASSNSAYPITLYDYLDRMVVRKLRLTVSAITALHCTSGGAMIFTDLGVVYHSDSRCSSVTEMSSATHTVCFAAQGDRVAFSTKRGVALAHESGGRFSSTIRLDVISGDAEDFRVRKLSLCGDKLYVVWTMMKHEPHRNLTMVCLKTFTKQHYKQVFVKGSCTHMLVFNDTMYCATQEGNMFMYSVGSLDGVKCVGYTLNRQELLGLGMSSVRLSAFENGIIAVDRSSVRVYELGDKLGIDYRFPFSIIDFVTQGDTRVLVDGSAVYWYDKHFKLTHRFQTRWNLRKLSIAGEHVVLLYDEDERTSGSWKLDSTVGRSFSRSITSGSRLAVLRDFEIHPLPITATSVLMSLRDVIVIAKYDDLYLLNNKLEQRNTVCRPDFVDGSLLAGCAIADAVYCLYTCHTVVVWTLSEECDMQAVYHMKIDPSISDIQHFKTRIIGFSSVGTIFVFDDRVNLLQCIVSHPARQMYGTRSQDGIFACDRDGVAAFISEFASKPKETMHLYRRRSTK